MISLKLATKDDLPQMANLHKKLYSSSHFTSFFSQELLIKYYGYFFEDTDRVIKAVAHNSNMCGFVVVGSSMAEKINVFKKENRADILKTALCYPKAAAGKVIASLFFKLFDKHEPFSECPFLILSIVSDRSSPTIGPKLLTESKKMAKLQQQERIGLYVRINNIRAVNFYLKNGFSIKGYSTGQFYLEASTS
ncbi:ribosomal protein S18 acetylase RimI-like enzyme [Eoetvoesiella caeni]|uniref:Ribosomal protein S18 acetylase RimI-like enzyme n=2 Tax=Eoetvoesiella caeni TaxID=645616 RepID=A0A366HHG4_9BURK|nr:ribosomal protein S18 acetylase RimI-like enzyme [Eoetvoesiella caeni]